MVSKRDEGWLIGLVLVLSIGLAGAFFCIVGLAHQVSGATAAARSAQHQVDDLRRQLAQAHKLIKALQQQVRDLGGDPVTSSSPSGGQVNSNSKGSVSTPRKSSSPSASPPPSPSPTGVGSVCKLTTICLKGT